MNFEYSQEQKLLRDLIRQLAREFIEPGIREADEAEAFPREVVREMARLGLLGAAVPEAYSGGGLDLLTQAIIAEEMGRASAALGVTFIVHGPVLQGILAAWGSEAQKGKWLPLLARGEVLGGVAAPEKDGPGLRLEASGRTRGGEARFSGEARWVLNGGVAGVGLLILQGDEGSFSGGLLVPRQGEGLRVQEVSRKLGLRTLSLAHWELEGLSLPEEALLKGGRVLADQAQSLLNLFLAAVAVGLCQACQEAGVAHAKQRIQFGRPIGSFQLVQDLVARMTVETEAARLLVYEAAAKLPSSRQPGAQAAMARALACRAALQAGTDSVQIHGGYGFSSEYPVERYFRDARALSLLSGGTEGLSRSVGAEVLGDFGGLREG